MTTFHGGPGDGRTLLLKNSPPFIRLVVGRGGKWDALDKPNDQLASGEVPHAYRLVERRGSVHLRPGGFFPLADYQYLEQQPPAGVMFSTRDWAEWCRAQPAERGVQ